jgi:hypothetical protein
MWFSRLSKKKAGIVFKSGKEVILYCDKFTWKTRGNEMVSYEIEGMVPPILSHLDMSEVACVVTYRDGLTFSKPSAK